MEAINTLRDILIDVSATTKRGCDDIALAGLDALDELKEKLNAD